MRIAEFRQSDLQEHSGCDFVIERRLGDNTGIWIKRVRRLLQWVGFAAI